MQGWCTGVVYRGGVHGWCTGVVYRGWCTGVVYRGWCAGVCTGVVYRGGVHGWCTGDGVQEVVYMGGVEPCLPSHLVMQSARFLYRGPFAMIVCLSSITLLYL